MKTIWDKAARDAWQTWGHFFSTFSGAALPKAVAALLALTVGLASGEGAANEVQLSPNGEITGVALAREYCPVASSLGVYQKGWKGVVPQARASIRRNQAAAGVYATEGALMVDGREVEFAQTVAVTDDGAVLRVEVTAAREVEAEALVLSLALPEREYRGGGAVVGVVNAGLPMQAAPGKRGQSHVLAAGEVDEVAITAPGKRAEFKVTFDRKSTVQVQDARQWGDENFLVFVEMHRGRLQAGRKYALEATLRFKRAERLAKATVAVDPAAVLYPFKGFGGNYCFQIDNHVTRFHLRTLRTAVARTEISIRDWEPENDNDNPAQPNRAFFAAQDREGTKLHSELLLGRELAEKGVPVIASIWYLPEWMLENPGQDKETNRRRLPRDNWPEFAESLVAYIDHARERYGWEPAMFSFNEPEAGIKIRFSAAEHADLVKYLGRRFAARGINTRLLLGDTASPANALSYWPEAMADAEARRYVGGVSFHSWGGAAPEVYQKLAAMARQYGKPLYVGEVGTDPGAWRTGAYRGDWNYALKEIRLYMDLLAYAAPQATLQWQFSDDYPLSEETPDGAAPTKRYWVMKQFCNWTPTDTRALGVASSSPAVRAAAFGDPGLARVIHVANLDGVPCRAAIAGLGAATAARGVTTGRDDNYRLLDDLAVRRGALTLDLPPQSLTTLEVIHRH